ncbi:MAG: DME family drug/metabolite transporter [Polaribacter sp.]|jgi:DME family drug/metabolite transporter
MTASTLSPSQSVNLTYFNGVLLVLLAGVFWSSMGIGIRSIEAANVWQILLYRSCSLSLFLFVLIAFRSGFKPIKSIKKAGVAGIIGGWGLVVAFSGGVYAIQTTTVANAMFLFASAPFFAAIFGWFILRESVRKSTWIATLVAALGVAVMVIDGFSAGHMVGNVSALLSALGFAIFTIALRWGKLEDMLPAVFLAGIFAAVTSAIICYFSEFDFVLSVNDASIALVMGVFQVGAGLAIYTIGSKVVPAAELTLLSLTEVLLGPLWVWIFVGETASFYTLAGGVILLIAIAGNALSGLRRKPLPLI